MNFCGILREILDPENITFHPKNAYKIINANIHKMATNKVFSLSVAIFKIRRRWDSNPRVVAHKLISSQPRYDRFDTSATIYDKHSITSDMHKSINNFYTLADNTEQY